MEVIKAFCAGFRDGNSDVGRTYDDLRLSEAYDWGRSLRRLSRQN
jgi:hypothetical protein